MTTNNTANQELRLNTVEQVARNLASYLSHRCECDECGYAIATSFKVIQTDMENLLKEHTRSHPTPCNPQADREVIDVLNLAWRDILEWEQLAEYQRKHLDQNSRACPTDTAIRKSESVRHKLSEAITALEAALGKADGSVEVDGRKFATPMDAALHLLWLLQRLSYFEPHREGQPSDGFRFRQGIIEARKLLKIVGHDPSQPEIKKDPTT